VGGRADNWHGFLVAGVFAYATSGGQTSMRLSWFRAAYSLVATISDRRFDVTSDRTLHHSFGQPGDARLQDGAHFEAPHHGREAEVRDAEAAVGEAGKHTPSHGRPTSLAC
jgi:hypothetical protein